MVGESPPPHRSGPRREDRRVGGVLPGPGGRPVISRGPTVEAYKTHRTPFCGFRRCSALGGPQYLSPCPWIRRGPSATGAAQRRRQGQEGVLCPLAQVKPCEPAKPDEQAGEARPGRAGWAGGAGCGLEVPPYPVHVFFLSVLIKAITHCGIEAFRHPHRSSTLSPFNLLATSCDLLMPRSDLQLSLR